MARRYKNNRGGGKSRRSGRGGDRSYSRGRYSSGGSRGPQTIRLVLQTAAPPAVTMQDLQQGRVQVAQAVTKPMR